jgi:hypothetical protein
MCAWKEEGKETEASKSKKQSGEKKKKKLKEVGNLCTYEPYLNILNLQYETIGSR